MKRAVSYKKLLDYYVYLNAVVYIKQEVCK